MKYTLHQDGSLSLSLGGFHLTGGYPAVDGVPVRPMHVEVTENEAHYALIDGSLTLRVEPSEDGFTLFCQTDGLRNAHDVSPIAHWTVKGCEKVFRQGFGIGGPSGFAEMDGEIDSDALIAVGNDDACLTLHARDHSKYRVRYEIRGGCLSAFIDAEGTLSGETELPALYLRLGSDFSSALSRCAKEIAETMHARPRKDPAFHWCSWYYLYHTLDQATLEEYLSGFQKHRELAPFRHIQIDAGYYPSCGDWLIPNHRFPGGLEQAARTILDAGYQPGVWVGAFMVGDESKLYHEHPDWLLHDNDGELVTCWRWYNEPKPFGYRDSHFFVLDTSHPDAMEYLYHVFATLRSWGYTLFKTDFLLWGMQDSTKVRRYTPGKTSFEYYRDAMQTIRRAIGEDSAWLGCIAPFMPMLGFCDMMRIGGDVGAQWEKDGYGPTNMIREILADQYFNNVYWQNDPDAVLLRDFHIHLKGHQIEALALLQAMSGGVITTSDPIHAIAQERRDLLRLIRPRDLVQPEYPDWQNDGDVKIVVNRTSQGAVVYFFNPTARDTTLACDWNRILGDGEWSLRRLHGESMQSARLACLTVPAQSGVLFFASKTPLDHEPRNLWDWNE